MANVLDTPQLGFPFNVVGGKVVEVEQGSATDVVQNVLISLRYLKGERPGMPDFGIPDQALRENGLDVAEVMAAVLKYEPDADLELVKNAINMVTGEEFVDTTVEAVNTDG